MKPECVLSGEGWGRYQDVILLPDAMRCPKCGKNIPETIARCECGYEVPPPKRSFFRVPHAQKLETRQIIYLFLIVVIVLPTLFFGAGILINSRKLASITVTRMENVKEPRDFGLGKRFAPDYRLLVITTEKVIDCGTFQDTFMKESLSWNVPHVANIDLIKRLRLLERDPGYDDLLVEIPFAKDVPMSSSGYTFTYTTAYSLDAGFQWFIHHPLIRPVWLMLVTHVLRPIATVLGLAILLGLIIALLNHVS